MKKTLLALSSLSLATSANAALILTSIYDGHSSTPKGIEVYVTTTGSYNGWTVDTQFNAATSWNVGYTFDTTVYTAGTYLYITSTASDTTLPSGSGYVTINDLSFNMNGDDRVRLTDGSTTIDQYGVTDTDGTGASWEYTDSFAYRIDGTTANGTFTEAHWNIAAVDTLDPTSSQNTPLANVLGTYSIPEPSTALLSGLTILSLVRRRRA